MAKRERVENNSRERENMQRMMDYSRNTMNMMEQERRRTEQEIMMENLSNARFSKHNRSGLVNNINSSSHDIGRVSINSRNHHQLQSLTSSPGDKLHDREQLRQHRLEANVNMSNSFQTVNKYRLSQLRDTEMEEGKYFKSLIQTHQRIRW